MKTSQQAYDDLTAVRGIGPARQQWLRESFNVRAYTDLAALSVDQIAARLKADGQITSRNAIAAWLVKAQELAAKPDGSSQRNVKSAGEKVNKKTNPTTGDADWKPFATFVVEYQARKVKGEEEEHRTKVNHMETDAHKTWPGIESQQLCQWMLGQAGEKVQQEAGKSRPVQAGPAEEPPTEQAPAQVAITQVRVFQPPGVEASVGIIESGKPFPGLLRGDEPFAFEVSFELAGKAATEVAKREIIYEVRSYAYDRSTAAPEAPIIPLGDAKSDTLAKGKLEYTVTLPEATLHRGMYRMWVLVVLEATSAVPDYLEVPLLEVA